MNTLQAWAQTHAAHVLFVALIAAAWYAFCAILTFAFRKHSADEYAKLPRSLGHLLRLAEASGLSSPMLIAFFAKLFFPNGGPPSVPMGPYRENAPPPADPTAPVTQRARLFFARLRQPRPLRGAALAVVTLFCLALPAFETTGCNLPPKTVQDIERGALSVEQIGCVLAQDQLGAKEPAAIATVCAVPPELLQALINMIAGQRAAAQRVSATRDAHLREVFCAPDAGTADAGK